MEEKIILKDGTEFEIENGASENSIQIVISNVDEFANVFKKFTESNLESYKIKNSEGLTCSIKENKYLVDAIIKERKSDVLVTIRLSDVDMTQKQLNELKSSVSKLEASQDIQDEAINDLGCAVSGIVEGVE